jgi:hypothetical protein
MAKPPANLRDAVEKTVEATLGSAERSRSAAQGALDDLELKAELGAIGRRLDKLEERLPAKRGASKTRARAKAPAKSTSTRAKPASKRAKPSSKRAT